MRLFILLLLTIGILSVIFCSDRKEVQKSIVYPDIKPDSLPLPFLPGIVSSDSLDFNSAFSRDGKSFFFSRSRKGKYQMLMTRWKNGKWSTPQIAPFMDTTYSEADPFITSDGSVFYISNRPVDEKDTTADFDIWVARSNSDSTWAEPENLTEVNSDSTEYYVSLSTNGNLYFASDRNGAGAHDIYVSKLKDGRYQTPVNLGASINSEQMEHDPFISPDEKVIIFTSVGRPDGYGEGDLYYSINDGRGNWSTAKNMGERINTKTYEYCSYLTPDARFFFYSSEYDVKWVAKEFLPDEVKIAFKNP